MCQVTMKLLFITDKVTVCSGFDKFKSCRATVSSSRWSSIEKYCWNLNNCYYSISCFLIKLCMVLILKSPSLVSCLPRLLQLHWLLLKASWTVHQMFKVSNRLINSPVGIYNIKYHCGLCKISLILLYI